MGKKHNESITDPATVSVTENYLLHFYRRLYYAYICIVCIAFYLNGKHLHICNKITIQIDINIAEM